MTETESTSTAESSGSLAQVASQGHLLLNSITPLLNAVRAVLATPAALQMFQAIAGLFHSVEEVLRPLEIERVQQLLKKVNTLSDWIASSSELETHYLDLLEQACQRINEALNQTESAFLSQEMNQSLQDLIDEIEQYLPVSPVPSESETATTSADSTDVTDSTTPSTEVVPPQSDPQLSDSKATPSPESHDSPEWSDPRLGPARPDPNAPSPTETIGMLEEADTTIHRHNFLNPVIAYFEALKQKLVQDSLVDVFDEKNNNTHHPLRIVADDGLTYDEDSVEEALALCDQMQNYLSHAITDEQFHLLASTYIFYRNPEQLLDHLKLLFTGDVAAKEKILRIYTVKAIGSYNVIMTVKETPSLFNKLPEEEAQTIQSALQDFAENPLRQCKNLMPRSIQGRYTWSRKQLKKNISAILRSSEPIFKADHNYNRIVKRYRKFVYHLLCNPGVFQYLEWKDKYLRYWIYTELYRLDIRNLISSDVKIPRYSRVKIKGYQRIETIVSVLSPEDQFIDRQYQLSKSTYTFLSQGENYMHEVDGKNSMQRARDSEKRLLDALSISQTAALAEFIHQELGSLRASEEVPAEMPASAKFRSLDIASEQQIEKAYQTATIKMHWEAAKKYGEGLSKILLDTFKAMAQQFNIIQEPVEEETEEVEEKKSEEPEIIARAPGATGDPLDQVEVDWIGYGKDTRSHVYDPKVPNLQRTYFEHGGYHLYLFTLFQEFVQITLKYYNNMGYLKKNIRKHNYGGTLQQHRDQAIYLRTYPDTVVALGKTNFSRTKDPVLYFQLYRKHPAAPVKSKVSHYFQRMMDGELYHMEDLETSGTVRPLLFQSLILVIDSMPDELRNQRVMQLLLKGMYDFLERHNAKSKPDRRQISISFALPAV